MLSYGLPLPLRLLDGRVLTSSRATAIRRLAPRPVARQIAARGRLCAGRGWSTGDGLKPLYGRLMALAMWPG